jgi:type IV pilus assembly protein PilF
MRVLLFTLVLLLGISGCATETYVDPDKLKEASRYNSELGVAYLQQGRFDLAIKKLKKSLQQNPDNADAHHYIAELYHQLGKISLAEGHFEMALELAPDNSSLKNNYGVFLCEQKEFEQSKKLFLQVSKDPLYANKALLHENIGLCAKEKGDLKTAEQYFRKTLRERPNSPKSLLALAELSFDKQDYSNAKKYFYNYLKVSRHSAASLWLGILLEKYSGNTNRVKSYSILLKGKFPDSKEAGLLKKMESRS